MGSGGAATPPRAVDLDEATGARGGDGLYSRSGWQCSIDNRCIPGSMYCGWRNTPWTRSSSACQLSRCARSSRRRIQSRTTRCRVAGDCTTGAESSGVAPRTCAPKASGGTSDTSITSSNGTRTALSDKSPRSVSDSVNRSRISPEFAALREPWRLRLRRDCCLDRHRRHTRGTCGRGLRKCSLQRARRDGALGRNQCRRQCQHAGELVQHPQWNGHGK